MLKHAQMSPFRSRADSISLSSNSSYSSLSSERLSSRSSSYSSLSESSPSTTIKVYARCLASSVEYKTLSITCETSCREVVTSILNKYRMRHRDPNLFYLTMEVTIRRSGVRTVLELDDNARPAILQSSHPRGDSRFSLQMRRGGLVKIYDSVLMSGSQYKSLLISDRTTVDEVIQLLLNCYNSKECVEQFSLYEVCRSEEYQRKLHPDDCLLHVQHCWTSPNEFHLLVRRNLDFRPRTNGPWTPDLPSTPCSSRQSQPTTSQHRSQASETPVKSFSNSSLYADYENSFYI